MKIGITERGDAALDLGWKSWVAEGKPAILITKDPGKLIPHLGGGDNVIIHCTITGHGGSILEPNVPRPASAWYEYMKLFEMYSNPGRIVLRIDPIIPTLRGYIKARTVADWVEAPGTSRVRISFMDNYPHVKERFKAAGFSLPYKMHAPLVDRQLIYDQLNEILNIEICGEPDMKCTGCISKLDCEILGVDPTAGTSGQRKACACLSQKYELLKTKGQCAHGCLYCYWK